MFSHYKEIDNIKDKIDLPFRKGTEQFRNGRKYSNSLSYDSNIDKSKENKFTKIAESFNFGLKDSISHVVEMQNFLVNCKGPEEVFLEMETNSSFRQRCNEIRKKYDLLLAEAEKNANNKVIFYDYSGDLSISADLSNKLRYKNQDKFVVVCYKNGPTTNISMRGNNVRAVLDKVLKKMENATGGGHKDAVGARIRTEDLDKFKELFEAEISGK